MDIYFDKLLNNLIPGDNNFPCFTKIHNYKKIYAIIYYQLDNKDSIIFNSLLMIIKNCNNSNLKIKKFSKDNKQLFYKILDQIYLFYYSNYSVLSIINKLGYKYNSSPLNNGYEVLKYDYNINHIKGCYKDPS